MTNTPNRKKTFAIKHAALKSGLSTHLVRVWEKRYQAVSPGRTESNRRLYSEADVLRLQMLKKAVDAGHSISQVAKLSSGELLRNINSHSPANQARLDCTIEKDEPAEFYNMALTSVLQLDAKRLESVLTQAAVQLTKPELINSVVVPLCAKIGKLWRKGELKIINEHIATPVIRSVLWNLLRSADVHREAPRIIVATPLNHQHELGALSIALIVRESGWRSLYFGSNLPATEIAAAVRRTKSRAVALSITFSLNHQQLVAEIEKLRGYLSKNTAIFIGGQVAANVINHLEGKGVKLLLDLESLNTALDDLLISNSKSVTSK